jgi:hypothetical protein
MGDVAANGTVGDLLNAALTTPGQKRQSQRAGCSSGLQKKVPARKQVTHVSSSVDGS